MYKKLSYTLKVNHIKSTDYWQFISIEHFKFCVCLDGEVVFNALLKVLTNNLNQ